MVTSHLDMLILSHMDYGPFSFDDLESWVTNLKLSPVEILQNRDYVCISLSGSLQDAAQEMNDTLLREVVKFTQSTVAFSMINLGGLSEGQLEIDAKNLVRLITVLSAKKKKLVMIKCPQLLREFMEVKVPVKLEYADNLSFLQEAPKQGPDFKRETEVIVESTKIVFEKQFGIQVECSNLNSIETFPKGFNVEAEVIGSIDIISNQVVGQLIFGMSNSIVIQLCKDTLNITLTPEDPEFPQVVGEIANLVLGYTKEKLNREGYGIIQAIPKCFLGRKEGSEGMSLYLYKPGLSLKFKSNKGDFNLYLSMERLKS
ncbi:MAG: hypothetical protein ABIQ95_08095 [Bdellovibrionia bacterium]